jgi:hypothetical protein
MVKEYFNAPASYFATMFLLTYNLYLSIVAKLQSRFSSKNEVIEKGILGRRKFIL